MSEKGPLHQHTSHSLLSILAVPKCHQDQDHVSSFIMSLTGSSIDARLPSLFRSRSAAQPSLQSFRTVATSSTLKLQPPSSHGRTFATGLASSNFILNSIISMTPGTVFIAANQASIPPQSFGRSIEPINYHSSFTEENKTPASNFCLVLTLTSTNVPFFFNFFNK